jgi:hypothetical protein
MKISFRNIYEKVREGFSSNAIIRYYKIPEELLRGNIIKYKKTLIIDFYIFELRFDF